MLISEIWDEFCQYKLLEENRSPDTIVKYDDCIRRFKGLFGDIKVEDINQQTFWALKTKLKHLSIARVNSIIYCLRAILRYCAEEKEIEVYNPSKAKPISDTKNKEIIYLTNDEIRRFFEAMDLADIHQLRLRTLCEVILDTGARLSEALSLDRNSLKKEKTQEGTMTFAKVIGKGNKERRLIFSGRSMFWIERYLSVREDSHPALFVTHCEAKRLKKSVGTKDWKKIAERAGIEKPVTARILRHTFCTNLHKHGTDIQTIQQMAGHARMETTCRYYSHVDHVDLMLAKRKLNYDD